MYGRCTPALPRLQLGRFRDGHADEPHTLQKMLQAGADELRVLDARADQGPTIKRWRPRAQGRAFPIHKGVTHITVTVGDREG